MVRVAGVQFVGHADKETNIRAALTMVRAAADRGARIVCLPELFSTMYFCVERRREYFDWAKRVVDGLRGVHPGLERAFDREYRRRPGR